MAWLRSEEEVDEMIAEMMEKGKGKYITQSVMFKKSSEKQMELLKKTLMSSTSFGAFVKKLIADNFDGIQYEEQEPIFTKPPKEKKDIGNFF